MAETRERRRQKRRGNEFTRVLRVGSSASASTRLFFVVVLVEQPLGEVETLCDAFANQRARRFASLTADKPSKRRC